MGEKEDWNVTSKQLDVDTHWAITLFNKNRLMSTDQHNAESWLYLLQTWVFTPFV